jgi:phosphomannomutase
MSSKVTRWTCGSFCWGKLGPVNSSSVTFGTSGLRGLASELSSGIAGRYARAFAIFLGGDARKEILVASDLRDSSPLIKEQVMAGLAAEGCTPIDCGTVPTPALALAAMSRGLPSLMVTGSHIPAERNGIKFYLPSGEISKADEAVIARLVQTIPAAPASGTSIRQVEGDIGAEYMERYCRCLPANCFQGLSIGVFEHSTVSRDLMSQLLERQGADVVRLGRSSTFMAVDTESIEATMKDILKMWSAEHGLDAIVSADGDGDRPLITDETGRIVPGDIMGIITAKFLGAGAVVTPVTSNSGTEESLPCPVLRSRVGSPFVIAGMEQARRAGHQAIVGFEANGGVLLGSDVTIGNALLPALPTRDALLPIVSLLSACASERRTVSQLVRGLGLPITAAGKLENIPSTVSQAFMHNMTQMQEQLSSFLTPLGELLSVDHTDGLRAALSNRSIVHFRASGNEPALRCYAEAASEEEAIALLNMAKKLIGSFQHKNLSIENSP